MMTLEHARNTLLNGGTLPELMEAVAVAATEDEGTVSDLILGLSHPECVSEQAAIALYRRTGRPFPPVGTRLSREPKEWRNWLTEVPGAETSERELAIALGRKPDQFAGLHRQVQTYMMHGLSAEDRLIIALTYYERMTLSEIAFILDSSEESIRRRHSSILDRIRSRLETSDQSFTSSKKTA